MSTTRQYDRVEDELTAGMRAMYRELYEWRASHPEASFDEIAAQVTPRRRALMGLLVEQLSVQHGRGEVVEGRLCEQCGTGLKYVGQPKREVEHYLEGEIELRRAYYYCARCQSGIFPPGRQAEIDES